MEKDLTNIVFLDNASQYDTLLNGQSVTLASGQVITYEEGAIYYVPDELASTTKNGLMSKEDKIKLNGLSSGTKLYKHTARYKTPNGYDDISVVFINSTATAIARTDIATEVAKAVYTGVLDYVIEGASDNGGANIRDISWTESTQILTIELLSPSKLITCFFSDQSVDPGLVFTDTIEEI